jgi:putative transposase
MIDKFGASHAGLQNRNFLLILNGWFWLIDILQVKYLNNITERTTGSSRSRGGK